MWFIALAAGLVPAGVAAQGFGFAVRAGTLGLGGEVAVGLSPKLGLRGGIGTFPVELNGNFSDVDYTVSPPSSISNLAVDIFPTGGGFRFSAGFVFKPDDVVMEGEYSGTVDIGGRQYTGSQVGTMTGSIDHKSLAPYASFGWGRAAGTGVGMFAEFGVAALGDPDLLLEVSGPIKDNAQFKQDLERERAAAEEDLDKYARFLPILSLGVRIGVR